MAEYRIYCIGVSGHIVHGENIEADDLDEAVATARTICSRTFHQAIADIEVWQGNRKLFRMAAICPATGQTSHATAASANRAHAIV